MVDFVFLHGGGQGSWVWEQTIAAMAHQSGGTARCLALDMPGCGAKRGRDTSAIGFDAIAPELLADIDAAGMGEVVLVGHSQAGCVLPRMVEARPGRFRRLVYVSCSSPLAGQTVIEMIGDGVHGEDPGKVGWPDTGGATAIEDRYAAMFCNDMDEARAGAFLALLGRDQWPASAYAETGWRYGHLNAVPASYVACLRDGILPVGWQERFADRYRCDRVVRIDAGHQVMNTRPQALAEVLLAEAAV